MEVRDSMTLAIVNKVHIEQVNANNSLDRRSKYQSLGEYNISIPISLCISPNNTLVCVLDYSPNLHIIQLPPRDPSLFIRDPFDSHFISDKLERSMLFQTDYWDILAYISTLPSYGTS